MVDCTTILLLQPRGGARAMGTNTMALIQTCQIQAIRILYRRPGVTVPKGLAPSCTIRPWTGLGRILESCLCNHRKTLVSSVYTGVQRLPLPVQCFRGYDSGYDWKRSCSLLARSALGLASGEALRTTNIQSITTKCRQRLSWGRLLGRPCPRRHALGMMSLAGSVRGPCEQRTYTQKQSPNILIQRGWELSQQ